VSDPVSHDGTRPSEVGRLIFERSTRCSRCTEMPALDVPDVDLEVALASRVRRESAALPEVTEVDLARHYQRLASVNFGVDSGFYPLGSCTMKYNPKVGEVACRLPGFAGVHPYQPESTVQGMMELLWWLAQALGEIAGLPHVTLQPAAGAHGEFTGLMCIRAYHTANGDARTRVVIPDSAHGTNPATVATCGYEVTTVPSDERGGVDLEALRGALGTDVAAIMLTNPNTLGLFDENIAEITRLVHECGALAYCDGANLNAVLGKARPGDMGFDAMHINLHKTFATPHGGGGPGAGPVAVNDLLAPFLPGPRVVWSEDAFRFVTPERSIGRVRSFCGNVGVAVRAYAYIRAIGGEGLREVAEQAVLSANYLKERLKGVYELPYDRPCMHEFVLSGRRFKREHGVRTLDIAKRLLDHGVHPPTIYFPLIVDEAIMIEPTETESLETLDRFVDAMLEIASEAVSDPQLLHDAPTTTPVRRLDEARAVKQPELAWRPADLPCVD
jgi:glycine dehydrogenase subunit 2